MTSSTSPLAPVRAPASAARAETGFGNLPEWNLADLYPSMDSAELKSDLVRARTDAEGFEAKWKGKLGQEAEKGAAGGLGRAMAEYEALEELIGKVASYAALLYTGDTQDPKRAKLYGDVQEKLTDASSHLLFFTLEMNRLDDALIDAALAADPSFGRYRPWVIDLRLDKPYQLEDRIEQLFHEKSVTGRGAWNRLFDETMTSLRFEVGGETLPLEPTLNKLQDADPAVREEAARPGFRGSPRN